MVSYGDCQVRIQLLAFGLLALMLTCTRKVTKGPLSYGPKGGEKWSWTLMYQKVTSPICGEQ